jgi:EmrB/QacA subfamily drug resistance transporter
MFATSLALIAQAFSGKERGTAFGVYGAVVGGAVAIGPLLGGAITSGIGWRWIFFVNLPIGALAIIITLAKVRDSTEPTRRRLDVIGFLTFSTSLFLLVFALVQGNAKGWGSRLIVSLFIGSAILMLVFLIAEWRQADPMLDLTLFKRPAMTGVSIAAFTLSASIFAMFLYLTLYLQEVLGYGPFAAGVRFLPVTVLAFLAAPFAGKLSVRIHSRYLLFVGLALVGAGCGLATHVQASSTWTVLLPGFIVAGLGIGVTNPVLASASVSVVPPERSGMASGSSSTFRQVGIATGIAGLGAIFLSQVKPSTINALEASPQGRLIVAHDGARLSVALAGNGVREASASLPASTQTVLLNAYKIGFTSTFDHLMTISMIVAFLGAVASLALIRQRDFVPSYSLEPDEELEAARPEPRPRHAHSKRRAQKARRERTRVGSVGAGGGPSDGR